MAQAESPEAVPDTEAAAPTPPKRGRIKALLVLLVLSGSAAAAYTFFGAQLMAVLGLEPTVVEAKPIYLSLDPPFVVNLEESDLLRFLQVEIQVMTHDPLTSAALDQHSPLIRNNLLLILAAEKTAALASRDGKADLQQRITAEINAVLATRGGGRRVEETYFTSFVMQ